MVGAWRMSPSCTVSKEIKLNTYSVCYRTCVVCFFSLHTFSPATPNGWCLENVSQLLVHCGKDISKGVLGCRAVNGRVEELVVICFYMANACLMKDGYEDGSEDNIRYHQNMLRHNAGSQHSIIMHQNGCFSSPKQTNKTASATANCHLYNCNQSQCLR